MVTLLDGVLAEMAVYSDLALIVSKNRVHQYRPGQATSRHDIVGSRQVGPKCQIY